MVLSPGKTIGLSAVPLVVVALLGNAASAQELTPRAYWPTPNGTNIFVLAYQRTSGDIVTDPSLPVTDVDSDIDYLQLSYQRTFSLRDRTATVQRSLPFSDGDTKGFLEDEFRRRETSGMGDARLRFAINLKGAPSMDSAGFKESRNNPVTVVGASLLILGQTREQDPVLSIEFHLVKRIRPGFWASLDANFYVGGQTSLGEEAQANLQPIPGLV